MKRNNQGGFTIVEVMIVLAIAGLILAVVFIAVPALQRNQRNSARQNDVAYIQSQFNQAKANKGNQLPTRSELNNVLKADEVNYISGFVTDSGTLTLILSGSPTPAQTLVNPSICEAAGQHWDSGHSPTARCETTSSSNTAATLSNICTGLGGTGAGTCALTSGIVFAASTTSTSTRDLEDTGNEALIVTKAKCRNEAQTYSDVDLDTSATTHVAVPDYPQQSAIFWRLEGDGNLYCDNI